MLHSITFKQDYRCFKKGDHFTFKSGINLLVGDQGTGKTTILNMLRKETKNDEIIELVIDPIDFIAFDFEKDTSRGKSYFVTDDITTEIQMAFMSHGEANRIIHRGMEQFPPPRLILLDEPDAACSIRSCIDIAKQFKKLATKKYQIIAAVHNPVIILAFKDVLSLEHYKWITSQEFVASHGWKK